MKIDKETREQMKLDILVVLNHFCKDGLPKYNELNPSTFNNIWFKTFANRYYPNDNANVIFVNGKRLLSMDLNYELYPCGSNDKSLNTTLDSIFKDILN